LRYLDSRFQQEFHCAIGPEFTGTVAVQQFRNGFLIWEDQTVNTASPFYAAFAILYSTGIAELSDYDEGSQCKQLRQCWIEYPSEKSTTDGTCRIEARYGFAKLFEEHPSIKDALGDALECEHGYSGSTQMFDTGALIAFSDRRLFALYGLAGNSGPPVGAFYGCMLGSCVPMQMAPASDLMATISTPADGASESALAGVTVTGTRSGIQAAVNIFGCSSIPWIRHRIGGLRMQMNSSRMRRVLGIAQ
jgi:hypothetical protein